MEFFSFGLAVPSSHRQVNKPGPSYGIPYQYEPLLHQLVAIQTDTKSKLFL